MKNTILKWEPEFTRSMLRVAVPITVQSLVLALMHIVDNLMIGQIGEYQLAGVSQANRVTFLLQVTMFGVVSGSSVFTAQYWGKRDLRGIRSVLGLGLMTASCVAALFALPSIIVPERILALLINDPLAVASGAAYLRIVGFAYFVEAISMVYAAVLKSTEQAKLPMVASIAAIITNTFFNYLLIFGSFGAPKLGVSGAAIATLIGASLELMMLVGFSYRNQFATAARLHELRPISRAFIPAYYKVVVPVMCNEGFWSLGMVVYSAAYGLMGTSTVAAISIFSNIETLSSVMLRGMTNATAVLVGIAVGARRFDDAKIISKRMLAANMLMGVVVGALVALFCGNIVSLFNVSAETAESARAIIRVYACFVWSAAVATVLIVGILRAGGDVRVAMLIDILPVWLIGVPIVFLTGPVLGYPIAIVYLCSRAEEVLKSGIALLRMRSGKWTRNLVDKVA